MAHEQGNILDTGDLFPDMKVSTVGGDELTLPEDFNQKWTVLLFYRGHW